MPRAMREEGEAHGWREAPRQVKHCGIANPSHAGSFAWTDANAMKFFFNAKIIHNPHREVFITIKYAATGYKNITFGNQTAEMFMQKIKIESFVHRHLAGCPCSRLLIR